MKPKNMKPIVITTAVLALAGLHQASAAILIQENFNYAVGNINGVAATGTGLSGNWVAGAHPSGSNTASNVVTGSLAFSGHFASSGGALRLNTTSGFAEGGAAAAVGATLTVGNLWSSSIMQLETSGQYFNDWVVQQRFNNAANGSFSTSSGRNILRAINSGTGSNGRGAVGSNSTEVLQGTGTNAAGTNYLLVTQYTITSTNITSARLFTFDQTSYGAYLTAANANPANAIALLTTHANHVLVDNDSAPLSNITHLQYTTTGGPIAFFDAYRLGTDVRDVVNVIPEPSAALLGGLGALVLLRRRRQQ